MDSGRRVATYGRGFKKEGKIAAMGISMNRWEPENGIFALETGLIDAVQVIYNIFDQAPKIVCFPIVMLTT